MSSEPLRRVEKWLDEHPLGPERRLPAERRLASLLDLSRAELRKALATIEAEGRLIRHVGRGTFLRPAGAGGETPAQADAALAPAPAAGRPDLGDLTSPRHLLQARLAIEPELARLAALHATRADLRALREREGDIRLARSWERYDIADSHFHRAIAAASGNPLLAGLYDTVADIRRSLDWGRLLDRGAAPPPDHPTFGEHAAIVEAIAARDRHAAADALRHHLMIEATALIGQVG